jgi:hypothetical protein
MPNGKAATFFTAGNLKNGIDFNSLGETMITAATAMPMPETGPSVNSNWIKANTVAAAIYAVFGTLTFLSDKLLAINDPATATAFRGIAAAIALAGTIVPIIAYAMLTGAVLREKLPAFSQRGWIAVHGSIGALLGVGLAAFILFGGSASNNAPVPTPSLPVILGGLAIGAVLAAMFGALMGSLQALVLRKAATGTGRWIVLSAIATPLMLVAVVGVAYALGQNSSGFAGGLVMQVTVFVAMIGAAVIMLPALNRLTPRG